MEPFGKLLKILFGKERQISWRRPFMQLEGSGLLAPEKVPGGHSIIRVIEKRDGQILPFEQVVKAVEGDMLTRHMDDLITRLRTDYTEIIKIDLDR